MKLKIKRYILKFCCEAGTFSMKKSPSSLRKKQNPKGLYLQIVAKNLWSLLWSWYMEYEEVLSDLIKRNKFKNGLIKKKNPVFELSTFLKFLVISGLKGEVFWNRSDQL